MNKIKTLYDVVQVMRKEEHMKGHLKMNVTKDDQLILDTDTKFDQSFRKGRRCGMHKGMRHRGMKHRGMQGHMKHRDMDDHEAFMDMHGDHHPGMHRGEFRKFSRLSMLLDLLNRMDIEALEDKKVLSLSMTHEEMPEELKAHMMKKGHHKLQEDMKEVKDMKFDLKAVINEDNAIDSVTVNLNGQYLSSDDSSHTIVITGSLDLVQ